MHAASRALASHLLQSPVRPLVDAMLATKALENGEAEPERLARLVARLRAADKGQRLCSELRASAAMLWLIGGKAIGGKARLKSICSGMAANAKNIE